MFFIKKIILVHIVHRELQVLLWGHPVTVVKEVMVEVAILQVQEDIGILLKEKQKLQI